jgi:hypothetical protein
MTVDVNGEPGVLLVGNLPFDGAEAAFRAAAGALGELVARLPDNDPGDPPRWVKWHRDLVERNPAFELDPEEKSLNATQAPIDETAPARRMRVGGEHGRKGARHPPRFRIRLGIGPDEVRFDRIGHAYAAEESYGTFARLRDDGVIRPGTRFQVAIPTAAAFLNGQIVPAHHGQVEPPYLHCLFDEVARIAGAIPHRDLAIQWDVMADMAQWEGVCAAHFPDVKHGVQRRIAQHCNRVPNAVELGLHLSYRGSGERYWMEPDDAASMVALLNGLVPLIERNIDYVHIPVPSDRVDDDYFAPLKHLKLRRGTRLFLGLVHPEDGLDGARERMTAARKFVPVFGIATECGLGCRARGTIPTLLRYHAELCALPAAS